MSRELCDLRANLAVLTADKSSLQSVFGRWGPDLIVIACVSRCLIHPEPLGFTGA